MEKKDLFYFCVGNGGHELKVMNNITFPAQRQYDEDGPRRLYRHMPFFAEKIEEHQFSMVQDNYGPPIIEEHNGQKYRMYYLKKCLSDDCVLEMDLTDILRYREASNILYPSLTKDKSGDYAVISEIGMVEAKEVRLNGPEHELKFQVWQRFIVPPYMLNFEHGSIRVTIEPDWRLFE